ncbi:MAG TPA: hypothetical protein VMX75_11370, partial [Spirochaetia bacterium]|nr:hypothetical protein [Spirochaetia bacterium]
MDQELEVKINRHKDFLSLREVKRPLIGFSIPGWGGLSLYTEDPENFFPKGPVDPGAITVPAFRQSYEYYARNLYEKDDLIRSMEPLPFFPWTEAAAGCPVVFTGNGFWSEPWKGGTEVRMDQREKRDKAWILRYEQFLAYLAGRFGASFPVGQAVLRGPLDMVAAAVGNTEMVFLFYDRPDLVRDLLADFTELFVEFLQVQAAKTPPFHGGYGLGIYHLWTPGTCARLQEDAMALISPALYEEFVEPWDRVIAGVAEYSVFHVHTTGLFLTDYLLRNPGLKIIQVSIDEGVQELEPFLSSIRSIQKAGKCLMLKGRFTREDFD